MRKIQQSILEHLHTCIDVTVNNRAYVDTAFLTQEGLI